jgi:tyrosine-protein phosphatase SIW14
MKILLLILSISFFACSTSKINTTVPRNTSWALPINNDSLNNFYKINDSIYRSKQPNEISFQYLNNFGMKSILNLREIHSDGKKIKKLNLKEYRVPMNAASFNNEKIIAALKIMKNSPKPLVVHCKHGSDRTGVVIAMYRIVFENWEKEKAIEELSSGGYGFHTQYKNIPAYIRNVDIDYIKKKVLLDTQ